MHRRSNMTPLLLIFAAITALTGTVMAIVSSNTSLAAVAARRFLQQLSSTAPAWLQLAPVLLQCFSSSCPAQAGETARPVVFLSPIHQMGHLRNAHTYS